MPDPSPLNRPSVCDFCEEEEDNLQWDKEEECWACGECRDDDEQTLSDRARKDAECEAPDDGDNDFDPETDPRRPTMVIPYGENIFTIRLEARKVLEQAGYNDDEVRLFMVEILRGHKEHCIRVVERWINGKSC